MSEVAEYDPTEDIASLLAENKMLHKRIKALEHASLQRKLHIHKLKKYLFKLDAHLTTDEEIVLESQSTPEAAPLATASAAAPGATEEVVAFTDEDAGWKTEIAQTYESTMDLGKAGDADLGNFLGRPIIIDAAIWQVGGSLYYQFNPWEVFLTNPRVQEKIANFELLRCNLNVKMLVSGTPFHYGRAIASYNPLIQGDQVSQTNVWRDADIVAGSQRPHFFINPAQNTGGEMSLPYFFPNNYMSLSRKDYEQMGKMTIKSFQPLRHANNGVDPVTVSVYVWATDVVLTMPTDVTDTASLRSPLPTILESQGPINRGGDEYGRGIISKPASAVAEAAGALTKIPFIRPYARATQIIASGVGMVAKLFGFSRPNIVTDTVLTKPSPTGNLANADAPDAALKLTLDSKCELSIDPRIVGLEAQDEMDIASIAEKESYLTQFTWPSGLSPDTPLFQTRVGPQLVRVEGTELHPTPMGMLSQYFSNWQGTIKFRFQIVKSQYHKGRLLVRFDPTSHSGAPGYNNQYTRVVDIAEEEDFEIEVGWAQARPWLGMDQISPARDGTEFQSQPITDRFAYSANYNGVLELAVVNDLTSPVDDSPIYVNVFVSAGDDMKWAAPNPDKFRNLHLFPPPLESQSQPMERSLGAASATGGTPMDQQVDQPGVAAPLSMIGEKSPQEDHTFDVYFGEVVTNLRQVFKRYVYLRQHVPPRATGTNLVSGYNRIKDFPSHSGYDPDGVNTDSAGVPCTVSQTSPISFFTPCFAAMRGGFRRKYLFSASGSRTINPVVSRLNSAPSGYVTTTIDTATATDDQIAKFLSYRYAQFSNAGATATNIGVNNTIEVELPFYRKNRFSAARAINGNSIETNSHAVANIDLRLSGAVPQSMSYQEWVAAGEDFSLHFWTGAPILYNYALTETT